MLAASCSSVLLCWEDWVYILVGGHSKALINYGALAAHGPLSGHISPAAMGSPPFTVSPLLGRLVIPKYLVKKTVGTSHGGNMPAILGQAIVGDEDVRERPRGETWGGLGQMVLVVTPHLPALGPSPEIQQQVIPCQPQPALLCFLWHLLDIVDMAQLLEWPEKYPLVQKRSSWNKKAEINNCKCTPESDLFLPFSGQHQTLAFCKPSAPFLLRKQQKQYLGRKLIVCWVTF